MKRRKRGSADNLLKKRARPVKMYQKGKMNKLIMIIV